MLMAELKTIRNKSLEWKHTSSNSRKDLYSNESSIPSLHLAFKQNELFLLSSETPLSEEVRNSFFSCAVPFTQLWVFSHDS